MVMMTVIGNRGSDGDGDGDFRNGEGDGDSDGERESDGVRFGDDDTDAMMV